MYIYRVTFLGGFQADIRANSPKEAWERAEKLFESKHILVQIINIKYVRG